MNHRNIPISMVCTTDIDGVIKPIKFKIKHKNDEVVIYRIIETKKVEHTRHCGVKTIFFYSVIHINDRPYDVVFRFVQDTIKWELAMI